MRRGTWRGPTTSAADASTSSGTSSTTIPYEELSRKKVKFPKRQKRGDYVEPDYPYRYVKERY